MPHFRSLTLFGTSAGFTGVSFVELCRRVDWPSFLGFAGSAVATVVGWWMARRAELARQRLELAREEAQAARDERQLRRDEQLAELVFEVRRRRLENGELPCDPPSISSPSSAPPPPSSSSSSPA
jgi:hypothetical protein